jgi:flagellar motor switch protein FliM
VMDEKTMRLKDIFDLRVGSQLIFNATPESLIEMRSGTVPMFTGRMGRRKESIAIQVDSRIDRRKHRG